MCALCHAHTPAVVSCHVFISPLKAVSVPVLLCFPLFGLLQRRAGGAGACQKGTRAQRRRRAYVCPLARRRVMRAPPYACAAAASPPLLGQASRGPARTSFMRGATAARLPSSSAARRARRRVVDAAHVAHAGHRPRRRAAGRRSRRGRAAKGAGGGWRRLWARVSAAAVTQARSNARTVMSEEKLPRASRARREREARSEAVPARTRVGAASGGARGLRTRIG